MSSFAFSGPAIVNGIHFERKKLIALLKEQGHIAHKKVRPHTDYLVCDTEVFTAEVVKGSKKFKDYMSPNNTHTLRLNTETFLIRMGFL